MSAGTNTQGAEARASVGIAKVVAGSFPQPAVSAPASTVDVDRAQLFLAELTELAFKTDQRCGATQVHAVVDRDPDDVQHELDLLRATICRLGWLADAAIVELGDEPYRGDAAAWMVRGIETRRVRSGAA